MGKRHVLALVLSLSGILHPALAQEALSAGDWSIRISQVFGNQPYLECYSTLDQLRSTELNRGANPEMEYEAIRLVGEAIRMQCESSRLRTEKLRLEDERKRLLGEANRLDAAWRVAHTADPDQYPDFPDRDRSQRRMRADAQQMFDDVEKLEHDIGGLAYGSTRLLRLAMAVDSGVQNDLLRRLLGSDPIPTG